jgi:hypothetical protein
MVHSKVKTLCTCCLPNVARCVCGVRTSFPQVEDLILYFGCRKVDLDVQLGATSIAMLGSQALAFCLSGGAKELTPLNILSLGGEALAVAKMRISKMLAGKSRAGLSADAEVLDAAYKTRLLHILQIGTGLLFP